VDLDADRARSWSSILAAVAALVFVGIAVAMIVSSQVAGRERPLQDRVAAWAPTLETDAVPAAERPRAVADLADSRWKGRLALEAGDWDWYVTLRDHWMKSEGLTGAQADRRFEAIWTPERHFHDFGGPYPNPAVAAAATASVKR
jgi:hypothetical protein